MNIMKKWNVVLELIRGYDKDAEGNHDYDSPIIERKEINVEADNEADAIKAAKNQDTSKLSVFDSYADETD